MNNQELEKSIIEEISKSTVPVNAQFIANKTSVSWGRANRILLSLTVKGKISAIPTTNGFVYHPTKPIVVTA